MAQDTARELRAIAAQCESQPVADLYYHRAHHRELVGLNRTLRSILTINVTGIPQNSVESYRLYMALVELMAEQMIEESDARVKLLNHQYARLNDLFELRIKGFDRLADRKEWQIYTH
ncbi:hypothetical protein Tel_00055 [Candidatus Tenderia electrophaga]|jgi:hypothetical protein|uniref:Uncharacterized protein n=1 Tax=Candidatus Tenderia electrophaga TaxID=1748243 RepID=A0A0S2T8Z8_9GAMM|nr:hypothetical protein Tel_00055 [Candidatus Tenderia electrophaga]